MATQNPVRSVKILSVIFNFTDAVVVRYVGRGSGVHSRPCHISIDLFFAAPGRYYTALGARRPSPSVVTLKLWFLSALVRHMALFWRPAFVRNSAFAVFSVRAYPVSHFLCPFTFRLFWPSALAYAMYTIPMHKVPGCSCSWYCTASLGTNI